MKLLSDFLDEKFIKLELESSNKNDVLRELAGLVKTEVNDLDKFVNELIERENAGSTALENGLAIPHVRSKEVKDFLVAVGTKKDGIEFDSLDGKKTNLFFLIATTNKYNDYHIETLANISKMISNEEIVDILVNTKSKEGFIDIIRQIEKIEN